MKSIHTLLAVAVASLIAVTFSYAGEDHSHESHVTLEIDGSDAVVADVSDLAIGESRQIYAGDKEVVITNTEDGLKIDIDGETVDVGGHGQHLMKLHSRHGAGDHDVESIFTSSQANVIVKHLAGEEGEHGYHFISGDGEDVEIDFDMDGDHEWIDADGEHRVIVFDGVGGHSGEAAALRLEASGALEGLDEAKKQEILDALRAMEGPHVEVNKEVIFIRKGSDVEE